MTAPFPGSPDFAGFNEPMRMECDIYDLVVEGEIPKEISGTWYRSVPDPQFAPRLGYDTYLSGDGMVGAFYFEGGHVDYRLRYVMTERLRDDRAARRSLHGRYRNPYTDDPSVQGRGRGVANTTPIVHAGRLLALKEDSRAWELDPVTLETRGEWDYQGKLRSQTMTAHTRWDPQTNELYFFGYEAGGLATRDVSYCVADKQGDLVHEEWFEGPYCALMHDFVVTKEHVVFPFFPITADLDRIKSGGPHWVWEPTRDSYIGIMPRDGSVKDLRWFKRPACSVFHFMNSYTDGSKVIVDACYASVNPFPFITIESGMEYDPMQLHGSLKRWTFDLSRPGDSFSEDDIGPGGDMPRVADKDLMKDYDIGYYAIINPELGPPQLSGPVYVGFNALVRIEMKSGRQTQFNMGNMYVFNEPVHIASKQPGHEGYLAVVIDDFNTFRSEIGLFEAADITKGPIARIKLPVRLRPQVHGNWVATP
ncbi:MAG: carotenoid oxygenase family protein [Gammaproteobacteria bacterium]|nr:carotenoid oxygenase family protein [Gammaproteobacteria bacterium]